MTSPDDAQPSPGDYLGGPGTAHRRPTRDTTTVTDVPWAFDAFDAFRSDGALAGFKVD